MGLTDADLVQRWQQGDATAFEALVGRWQSPLARFLYRIVGRTELVKDLCQEVFLRVYNAGPRYREVGAFSTWLYRIALNVARDAGRRQCRAFVLMEEEIPSKQAGAEAIYAQREANKLLGNAIAELPESLRLVLVLRHYEGMSFEQIARLTGVPASTLKSRFAVALNRLRARLQELGLGPEESSS